MDTQSAIASSPANVGYATFLAATAALGGFLFGYDSAVINGAVGGIKHSFASSTMVTGFAVASILLGCALGAALAGRLADGFGRRPVMIGAAVIFALTAAWSGYAGSSTSFTAARFMSGLGVGAASVVCPAYIAEIAPARIRGRLGSLQQLGIVVGIFAALLTDDILARAAGGVSVALWAGLSAWRWMFFLEIVPALLFGLAVLSVPESPRFLVRARREAEALRVMRRIEPATDESEIALIRSTQSAECRSRLRDLLDKRGRVLPIVGVGVVLSMLQQLVGINSIFYYGAVLWEAVGFTPADSLRINVLTGAINIVSTLVALALVDRVGRRPLLLAGSIGMGLSLAALLLAFSGATALPGGGVTLSARAGIVALAAANAYVFAFGLSWGPCVWILLGEMFPNAIRGAALAVAVFAQWIANWLVTVTFPSLLSAFGPAGAYGAYLLFVVLSIFFVRRRVPETRGKELEEMSVSAARPLEPVQST